MCNEYKNNATIERRKERKKTKKRVRLIIRLFIEIMIVKIKKEK